MGHALGIGHTVFLIDADQVSSARAKHWGTRGAIEVFGVDQSVRAWRQACAARGVSITATVAPSLREAADIDLTLRAAQFMALPDETRPKRIFIVSGDRRFMALAHRLCEAGIYAMAGKPPDVESVESATAGLPAFSLILNALSMGTGPVKAADIGMRLKALGLKPPGKLTDFARKAGLRVFMCDDGFYWIDLALENGQSQGTDGDGLDAENQH